MEPSRPVERDSKSHGVQSPCVLRPCSSRHHGIESQWEVLAFDIAAQALLRTHLCRYRHAWGKALLLCWEWRRSDPVDTAQDVGEQVFRDADLCHLERDIAAMAHDLRADLDELVAQRGQGPVLDLLRPYRLLLMAKSRCSTRSNWRPLFTQLRTSGRRCLLSPHLRPILRLKLTSCGH